MIWSDSACLTRGSLAPWPISSGFVMLPAMLTRRALPQQLLAGFRPRIADAAAQRLVEGRPIGRDGRQQRLQVGRPDDIDAAAEHLRREGEAGQRRIATVRAAHDGDAVAAGDAVGHRPFDRIDQVVVHLAAPFQVAGIDERLAESGRGAEVHRQHRKAAIRQPLRLGIEAVDVARPRAAVHRQHHRQRSIGARPLAVRQREIGRQLQAIARANDLAVHRRQA